MPIEIPTGLTPELVPLSWLIGEWEGQGRLGAGDADSPYFFQRASFRSIGLPYLHYTAQSWLSDEHGSRLRPLSIETGFWALERKLTEADGGPGLTPPDIVPQLRNAEAVEEKRNSQGGFDIVATIVHPGNIAELYYGTIKGPQIQLATDLVMRGAGSKDYSAATRIFGLVSGDLFWRWDVAVAAEEGAHSEPGAFEPHASAILKKLSGTSALSAGSDTDASGSGNGETNLGKNSLGENRPDENGVNGRGDEE